jgi:chromosome segregation ATPase
VAEFLTGIGKAMAELTASLKGLELPAVIIILFIIVGWILSQSKDKTTPALATSSMTMATTLINTVDEKSDMIVELMREQGSTNLKVVNLQNQMHQLEQRLEEAELSRNKLAEEIARLNQRVLELTGQLNEEREEKEKLLFAIADLQRQLNTKDEEIAGLRKQLAVLEGNVVVAEGD